MTRIHQDPSRAPNQSIRRAVLATLSVAVLLTLSVAFYLWMRSDVRQLVFAAPTLQATDTALVVDSTPESTAIAIDAPTASPVVVASHTPVHTFTPSSGSIHLTPEASRTPGPKPRIFVATEKLNRVEVFDDEPPHFVTAIPLGIFPHNISVSNDARYVGVANRHSEQVSIIDTHTLTEVVRIRVGSSPHDLSWSPDDKRIYVTQEGAWFISVIDTATWQTLPPIWLDTPTHDLTISPDGRQIWATTIRYRGLVIIDTQSGKVVDRLAYFPHGSHDAYFSPDGTEVWVTSSGFIENASQADPNVVIFDARTHAIKEILPMGQYPFHSVKRFRDGLFLPQFSSELWFSDRGLGGVIAVGAYTHAVLASIKTGTAPFHLSFGPNGLLYVANHDDSTFSVIDPLKREVLHTVETYPDPHGIVVIAAP